MLLPLTSLALATYILAFPLLYRQAGVEAASFSSVWLAMAGWSLGPWGGLAAGLANIPLHLALFTWVHDPSINALQEAAGLESILSPLLGFAAGTLRNLLDERTRTLAALRRRERTLRLLSAVNHATSHANTQEELIRIIPQVMVLEGGYRAAWAAHAEPDGRLEPLAWAGEGAEALAPCLAASWEGPRPTCLRLADPGLRAHRETAERYGVRAVLLLPVTVSGRPWGCLAVASAQPAAFSPDEQAALQEVAQAFGASLERVAALEALARHAVTDPLTGLLNRRGLEEKGRALLAALQTRNEPAALIFLDLDRFKEVNDTLGHTAGDQALIEVAHRLKATARRTDLTARVGGDEFALLLPGADATTAQQVARRLQKALEAPVELEGRAFILGASLGVARFPEDAQDLDGLIRAADVAMYAAKHSPAPLVFFNATQDQAFREQVRLEHELRQALAAHQIQVHLQPILDLRTGETVLFEALARWKVSPAVFAPLAEAAGFAETLDRQVLAKALAHLKALRDAGFPGGVTVNLSPQSFANLMLPDWIRAQLMAHNLPPERLVLEVTERLLLSGEAALATLQDLKRTGVRLALDDFGSGYSSLSYVHRFPVDLIKIDKSFVQEAPESPRAHAILEAIARLSEKLGATTLAEGIEREAELEVCRTLGIPLGQGFLLGKPMPLEAALEWLEAPQTVR
ncbi:diguanylate cyclase/phosphodiesterase with GAF sensor [Marinithermus hydrothermalis DSM 14884]|uniref:Diguanylate cyclase/phosphodiesterase with GAF sensor n=2 Tax=Marinithermus TaxID=186191 RepID=F2NPN6_MARHT|nr:diguanylate cyclase/phosphodiesterase with GAF sensor [Marinithermus hydrothermalis DSM 14884]